MRSRTPARFSWDRTTSELLTVYEDAMADFAEHRECKGAAVSEHRRRGTSEGAERTGDERLREERSDVVSEHRSEERARSVSEQGDERLREERSDAVSEHRSEERANSAHADAIAALDGCAA